MDQFIRRRGFALIIFGLIFIIGGYLYYVFLLRTSPGVVSPVDDGRPPGAFLLDVGSIVMLGGIAAICLGFVSMHRSSGRLIDTLTERERELEQALADSRRLADELQARENLLDSVFENAPVAFLVRNRDGVVERVNRTYLQWYGLDRTAVVGTRLSEPDAPDADAFAGSDAGAMRSRRIVRPFADGRRHTVQVVDFPIADAHGHVEKIGAISIDLTEQAQAEQELRENEQRYRYIFDAAPYPMYVHDGHRIVEANSQAARMYGYESVDEFIGVEILSLVHPDDREQYRARLKRFGDGEALPEVEDRRFRKDGSEIQVAQYGSAISWRGGKAVLAINRDVTQEREAEEKLRQAQKMEAIGQLTAGIAHDFNNILTIIVGNCELLEDDVGADNRQTTAIVHASERGAELTQMLLAFARKQVLDPKVVNANDLLVDVTGLLGRTLGENIQIEVVSGAGLWNCEVDPAQLESALVNLAINARDAMPAGGKLTIETGNAWLDEDYVTAQADVPPGQYVLVAVTDTGVGMAPDVMSRIFEPFYSTKASGVGSGLGLSMVYGFVKQSNGHIAVYSEPGEGTTVKLYLPRNMDSSRSERLATDDDLPKGRGEHILVVEDDPNVRMLTTTMLAHLGYEVIEADRAATALEALERSERIDLILTDIVLPDGMNGREFATIAKGRCPDVGVLYMSGYTENAIVHQGRLDADALLLQKPFRRAALARAVRQALQAVEGRRIFQ